MDPAEARRVKRTGAIPHAALSDRVAALVRPRVENLGNACIRFTSKRSAARVIVGAWPRPILKVPIAIFTPDQSRVVMPVRLFSAFSLQVVLDFRGRMGTLA